MNFYLESETLILSNAQYFLKCPLLFFLRAFSTFFCAITFTSYIVYFFFLSKWLFFFCFACLISALRVVHLSVACMHILWYLQKILPLCSLFKSLSSESLKVVASLFFSFFSFCCFLREHLVGLIFLDFQTLSQNSLS